MLTQEGTVGASEGTTAEAEKLEGNQSDDAKGAAQTMFRVVSLILFSFQAPGPVSQSQLSLRTRK